MIMTTGKVMGECGGRKERQNREKDNGENHIRLDRQEKYERRCCAGRRCQKLRVKRVDPNRTESVKLRSDPDRMGLEQAEDLLPRGQTKFGGSLRCDLGGYAVSHVDIYQTFTSHYCHIIDAAF